jgi:hypothetical protein
MKCNTNKQDFITKRGFNTYKPKLRSQKLKLKNHIIRKTYKYKHLFEAETINILYSIL